MKRKLTIMVLSLIALYVAVECFMPRLDWIGGAVVRTNVKVIDASTGRPIAGATVLYRQEIDLAQTRPAQWPSYVTDGAGEAKTTWVFGAGGNRYLLFRTGQVSFEGQMFVVEATGYETLVCPVSDYLGGNRSLWTARRVASVTLRLLPKGSIPETRNSAASHRWSAISDQLEATRLLRRGGVDSGTRCCGLGPSGAAVHTEES